MLVAASEKGVCRLSFGEDSAVLAARFPNAQRVRGGEYFAILLAHIVAAAEAPGEIDFAPIALDVAGTPFQMAIWQALRRMHDQLGIQRGIIVQTTTYGADHSVVLDGLAALGPGYKACANALVF
jgi:hypothetical protein